MEAPGFWDDVEGSQKKMKELKSLKDDVAVYAGLEEKFEDIETLIEMGEEENDPDLVPEVEEAMTEFEEAFEKIRIKTLLSERYDKNNAIVSLHAGAGGTESCDWCQMLYRMYTRWAADKGFSVEVLDSLDGDEAGIKSITFQVDGENAYGYLKSEHGVHRLVRISPFNAAGKRQTSFVSCDVMPDIEEDIDIEVKDEDIRIDTYRSSGAGGQHINKTSSAIRITHFPTGIVVTCQNERSQHMNKDKAMQMLKAKLCGHGRIDRSFYQWLFEVAFAWKAGCKSRVGKELRSETYHCTYHSYRSDRSALLCEKEIKRTFAPAVWNRIHTGGTGEAGG